MHFKKAFEFVLFEKVVNHL